MEPAFSYQFFNTTVSAWDAMYREILNAKKHIYWEVYTLLDDASGIPFINLLCQKAIDGVDVKVIVDAFGSFGLSGNALGRLNKAGVDIHIFNRLAPEWRLHNWWRRLWHRTHRKILIIDEEVAFVGGVNVEQVAINWDDLHLKLTGKVVRSLLFGFAKTYIRVGGDRQKVKHLIHPKIYNELENFRDRINCILHAPIFPAKKSPFKSFYSKALGMAKESFNLLTPYYVPDKEFLELVARAKKRGVKVNIILPWQTDLRLMRYMAKAFYGISSKAGAAFHFLKRMNHGKAISADNKIAMVGSANFTNRSFFLDQEAGVTFSEETMLRDLNSILENWKADSVPLDDLGFGERRWYGRFKDWWINKFKDYV